MKLVPSDKKISDWKSLKQMEKYDTESPYVIIVNDNANMPK